MRTVAMLAVLAVVGCGGTETAQAPAPEVTAEVSNKVVVYSGRSESLVAPIIEKAEEALKLDIEVQYGKTPELATRLLTEGAESPADVFFAQDSGHLGVLGERGLLAAIDAKVLEQVGPEYRGPKGDWVGTSGRLRVLVYDSSKLQPEELPKSLKDLADPKWKGKLGWAPTNGSFITHVTALRHVWGEDDTKAWLEGVKANEPKSYPKNSPQVKAAGAHEIELGWVNHYYLFREDLETTTARNYAFATPGDAGNLMMISGVAVLKNGEHADNAQKLAEWLVSEDAQKMFTQDNFEYPARPGTPLHKDVPPLPTDGLVKIEQDKLTDVGPTRKLLEELGLQ